MKKVMKLYLAFLLSFLMVEPGVAATCGAPTDLTVDLNSFARNANEKFRGPRTIVIQHTNPLRYDYSWKAVTSYSAAPDLWAQLIAASGQTNILQPSAQAPPKAAAVPAPAAPPPPQEGAKAQKPAAVSAATEALIEELALLVNQIDDLKSSVDAEFDKVGALYARLAGTPGTPGIRSRVLSLQSGSANATTAVKSAGSGLIALLMNSDSTIRTGGTLAPSITQLQQSATWTSALNASWPSGADLDTARRDLGTLTDDLNSEKNTLPAYTVATTRDLTAYRSKLDDLQTRIGKRAIVVAGDVKLTQSDGQAINAAASTAQLNHDYLQKVEVELAGLSGSVDQYLAIATQVSAILDDIKIGGDKYNAFVLALNGQPANGSTPETLGLTGWDLRLDAVKAMPNYQVKSDPFTCEYTFSTTKTVTVTFSRTDRMPGGSQSQDYPLGIMECASPFNVSAGVLFSFLTQREYGIQAVPNTPGSTNTTNEFVTTSDSSISFQPVALVSARLCELNEKLALGAAFGIGANISGQNSGGSSASFLLGPTLGIFRAVYVTPGLYLGRQTNLGGGFKVGEPVPASITTPPLQTSYKPAFGLAITFTKP
jgi:hypothetical protein